MNQFYYQLIKNKELKFQSGNLMFKDISINILTLPNITILLHILFDKYKKKGQEIVKELAAKQSYAFANIFFGNLKNVTPKDLNKFENYLNLFGYGNISLQNINMTQQKIIFKVRNSALCLMNKKIFGNKNMYPNIFLEGICSGIAQAILNVPMDAKETQCIKDNHDMCYIVASRNKTPSKLPALKKYSKNIFIKIPKQSLDNNRAELITKVLGHDMMNWNEGLFTYWGCNIVMMPTVSFLFLIHALTTEFGPNSQNILYHLARVQSKESIEYQIVKLGFNKDKDFLKGLLEHSDISGFGVAELTDVNFDKKLIRAKHRYNPYSYYYTQLFGLSKVPIDLYVSGLLEGMALAFFDGETIAYETCCVSKGDRFCVHQTGPANNKSYPLEKKYVELIEKNLIIPNFII